MTSADAIFSGTRAVDGLLLWHDLACEAKRNIDLLRAYQPGSIAYRLNDCDVLCYAQPVLMDCNALAYLPLVGKRTGTGKRLLCSADFSLAELETVADGEVCLLRGGTRSLVRLMPEQRLNIAKLLNVMDYPVVSALRFPTAVTATDASQLAAKTQGKSVREALGDAAPEVSLEQEKFLASLGKDGGVAAGGLLGLWRSLWASLLNLAGGAGATGADARSRAPQSTLSHDPNAGPHLGAGRASSQDAGASLMPAWLERVLSMLSGSSNAGSASGSSQRHSGSQPARAADRARSGPSVWQRLKTRLLQTNVLSRYFGSRQLAYLRRLQDMFDRGDLHEALRHAPGLGRLASHFTHLNAEFRARQNLSFNDVPAGSASGAIALPEELSSYLNKLYRDTFNKLEREGRVDEALFVLAELLESRNEALDYLESKERYLQAAELSLRWEMSPETSVRLLMLAGEMERAVLIARRSTCFAQAVAMLAAKHPKVAAQLRCEWAQYLADQQCWMDAVETLWPVVEARPRAHAWISFALNSHGISCGRAWARYAGLSPTEALAQFEHLRALLHTSDHADVRSGLAHALLDIPAQTTTPAHALQASLLFPWLVRDRKANANALSKSQLRRLMALSDDPFQQADYPDVGIAERGEFDPNVPLQVGTEQGNVSVHDVVRAASGVFLCASGEAGIFVVDQAGRFKKHLSIPAQRLIMSDNGVLCLALIEREDVWRVTRLHLSDYRHHDLGMLRLSFFAPTLRGAAWSVVQSGQICVLDVSRDLHSLLWHVGDIGAIVDVDYSFGKETYLVADAPDRVALWIYDVKDRRLLSREPIAVNPLKPMPSKLAHCLPGYVPVMQLVNEQDWQLQYKIRTPSHHLINATINMSVYGHVASRRAGAHFVLEFSLGSNDQLVFVAHSNPNPCLRVQWPGEIAPASPMGEAQRWVFTARTTESEILIFDAEGRVVYFDLGSKRGRCFVVRV